jgi:hypothetical protein
MRVATTHSEGRDRVSRIKVSCIYIEVTGIATDQRATDSSTGFNKTDIKIKVQRFNQQVLILCPGEQSYVLSHAKILELWDRIPSFGTDSYHFTRQFDDGVNSK